MKRLIPVLLLAVFAFAGCEKEPDMGKLDSKYLVYTNYDKQANFKQFSTYYLPDSILLIGNTAKPEYWKGAEADEILNAYAKNLEARGYTPAANKASADLGVQVSYILSTHYFTDYGQPEWWWNYPGYWGSGYWGNWGGWYYPYAVNYSYSTNSFITEIVNLTTDEGAGKKIPVLWTSYMSGIDYSTSVNKTLVVAAVNQAFTQSPYLTKK
ncbi:MULTISPECIES: DUF4136 domain-containing protein [Bacteroides]|uniref:DUF4136 domain-containing protein n=1 Tax=Bacteroides TaxID=816 RepID=UPI0005AB224A|nr:DUF4136 domain-containing protein [Bacteroides neonati]MCP3894319.1 DUF4136 domain-containing protein [Bacteroides sp.]